MDCSDRWIPASSKRWKTPGNVSMRNWHQFLQRLKVYLFDQDDINSYKDWKSTCLSDDPSCHFSHFSHFSLLLQWPKEVQTSLSSSPLLRFHNGVTSSLRSFIIKQSRTFTNNYYFLRHHLVISLSFISCGSKSTQSRDGITFYHADETRRNEKKQTKINKNKQQWKQKTVAMDKKKKNAKRTPRQSRGNSLETQQWVNNL